MYMVNLNIQFYNFALWLLYKGTDTIPTLLCYFSNQYSEISISAQILCDIGNAISFVITSENGSLLLLLLRCGNNTTRI